MSTFFEKLTGQAHGTDNTKIDSDESVTAVGSRGEGRRSARIVPAAHEAAAARSTRVRIETEEAASAPAEEEAAHEDEGELTVDIYDRGDSIVIQSTVAGVKPEDLDISISNDMVAIHGRRERFEPVREDNYYYKELFWGGFSRSVILPEEIEEDDAEAHLKHGLLTIHLPKRKRGVVQKLKVKVS